MLKVHPPTSHGASPASTTYRTCARPSALETGPAGANEWWEQAIALIPRLVAAGAAPEPVRLAGLVLGACPPERAGEVATRVRTALGAPPPAAELENVLPAGACAGQVERWSGARLAAAPGSEPLASWLRVWDWSPLLPARVLAGWEPLLERLRRLKLAGPADPRTLPASVPVTATTALTAEDLAELAEARGGRRPPPRWPRRRTPAAT